MKNLIYALSFTFIFIFSACEKIEKNTINTQEAQTILYEAITAYGIYATTQEEVLKAASKVENSLKSGEIVSESYPQITIEPLNLTEWPKTITIDYGTENYLCMDGRYRKGIMLITANNFVGIENTTWDISFTNFFQNDHKVEGTESIKYKGTNANNNPEFECIISDGKITDPLDKVFHFEQETTREWISGYDTHYAISGNTDDFCDDDYLISGIHNGVSSDGNSYTMETTLPLHINVCCKWVMDGKLVISLPNNSLDCEIDYRPESDTGEMCNGVASFSIFGITYPIELD